MNCKPNDVAYVVDVGGHFVGREYLRFMVGRIVTVRAWHPHPSSGEPVWTCDETPIAVPSVPALQIHGIPDCVLRPFNPGSMLDDDEAAERDPQLIREAA
jgi:hypothetical protein